MENKTVEEKIKVMQGFLEGKQIQQERYDGTWINLLGDPPRWNWLDCNYRIKPEAKTVPMSLETFPKRVPVWVRRKNWIHDTEAMVVTVRKDMFAIYGGAADCLITWQKAFDEGYEYATAASDWKKMQVEIES